MFLNPNHPGMNSARAVSSCAIPMVATVRTSRGDLENRLMNVRSTRKPRKMALTNPTTIATGYGMPVIQSGAPPGVSLATRRIAKRAGTAPRSPWAKLTMRFAR
jgi:hypothetical protein